MSSLVSVGIPFLNSQGTLENSVKSVIAQTYKNLEIILLDDGSTDNSLRIAHDLASKDSRVRVISDGKNFGLIFRLNQIIQMSNGIYFARMDSDDLMFPDRIEQQVAFLENHPDVDVLSSGFISLNKNFEVQGIRNCKSSKPVKYNFFKNGENILHPSVMAKKEWFEKNRYDAHFERAEDRELFCRTMSTSVFFNLTTPLMFYMDIQNLTQTKYLKSYRSERKVLKKHWRGNLSFFQFMLLFVRSLLKSFIIRIYFFLGAQDTLMESKNAGLANEDKRRYSQIVSEIISLRI